MATVGIFLCPRCECVEAMWSRVVELSSRRQIVHGSLWLCVGSLTLFLFSWLLGILVGGDTVSFFMRMGLNKKSFRKGF